MASGRLIALLALASASFVVLLIILFSTSPSEKTETGDAAAADSSPSSRRQLKPVPPVSSADNNNNNANGVVADDPVEQFFSTGLKDHPLDQCPKDVFFTKHDLAMHNTEDDLWILIHGYVLNVTSFVHHHPGGVQMIMKGGGGEKDAADLFVSYHQPGTISLFNSFCVGRIKK